MIRHIAQHSLLDPHLGAIPPPLGPTSRPSLSEILKSLHTYLHSSRPLIPNIVICNHITWE